MSVYRFFTPGHVQEMYDKHVARAHNLLCINRDGTLPQANDDRWRWEDKDVPRVISLLEFRAMLKMMENHTLYTPEHMLGINADGDPEMEYIHPKQITHLDFERDPIGGDAHSFSRPSEKGYDFVMMNQTLEHLYNPLMALENIYYHMAPGGLLYMNVPVVNVMHGMPFWFSGGFTPMGLVMLCASAGFTGAGGQILTVGSWGNAEYMQKLFTTGWCDYRAISNFQNDPGRPAIAWILVRKANSV